jgi:hypothetical protein
MTDGLVEYVSSARKKQLIEYLRQNKTELQLDDAWIGDYEDQILNQLVDNVFELVYGVPGMSVRLYFAGERPSIDSTRNTFEDVYPDLYRFLRGDFNPTGLRFPDAYSLEFTFHGQKFRVFPDRESILRTAANELRKLNNERELFARAWELSTSKRFLYLTKEQKSELQAILGEQIVPVGSR